MRCNLVAIPLLALCCGMLDHAHGYVIAMTGDRPRYSQVSEYPSIPLRSLTRSQAETCPPFIQDAHHACTTRVSTTLSVNRSPLHWSELDKSTEPMTINHTLHRREPGTMMGTSVPDENDLFEYFDPLLSPHAYPRGISPDTMPVVLGADRGKNRDKAPQLDGSSSTIRNNELQRRVGILLIDHGSRREESNQRIHRLAALYQQSLAEGVNDSNVYFFVQAAHMEIAHPNIPDALESLSCQHVDEIVCHPYFLSPGRHVTEDIPQIIHRAVDDLHITAPVSITDPVGTDTDLMIGAIHSLVRQKSQFLGSPPMEADD